MVWVGQAGPVHRLVEVAPFLPPSTKPSINQYHVPRVRVHVGAHRVGALQLER